MNLDFEKDMQLDESALDVEWLEQPRRMMRYVRAEADSNLELDKAHDRLKLVEAELDRDIRANPEAFGLGKITEGAIQAAILLSPRYQDARKNHLDAKHDNDIVKGAVRSISQIKDTLENLVRLHGQSYFAGPSIPRDLSKEWEEKHRQKIANAGVAGALKRRK